jgi:hypothetical protein
VSEVCTSFSLVRFFPKTVGLMVLKVLEALCNLWVILATPYSNSGRQCTHTA